MVKTSLVCALSLLLAACSPAVTSSPPRPAPVAVEVPAPTVAPDDDTVAPAQSTFQVDNERFSITLPGYALSKEITPTKIEGVTNEFVATSTGNIGTMPAIVSLNTFDLTDDDSPSDEEFGRSIAFLTMKEFGDGVILAKEIESSSKSTGPKIKGSIVVYDDPDVKVTVIQLAAGHNRTGFMLRCAGDAEAGEALAAECKSVLSAFSIK